MKLAAFKTYGSNIWILLKETWKNFSDDNAMKFSASLSYYTIFSLAPMLLIIIAMCSLFFGREAVQGEVYARIHDWVGSDAALQIQGMIKSGTLSNQSFMATAIGIATLIIGATGVFIEIQDSINRIWAIKAKPKKGWVQFLKNRVISFSLIVSLGFLLIVSLLVNTVLDLIFDRIEMLFPSIAVYILYIVNIAVVWGVITVLFAVIFRVLPDGKLLWKDAFVGAGVTGLLFLLGKFLIGYYLGTTKVNDTFGSSSAIVLILLWIYYSSVILYFGAEFTKVYTIKYGRPIQPHEYAVAIEQKEIKLPTTNPG